MLEAYRQQVAEREAEGIPPLPMDAKQTAKLVELIKTPPAGEADFVLDLFENRVPPGVDEASYVKASFLADVAAEKVSVELISPVRATFLLGTMLGGYNVQPLIQLLDSQNIDVAQEAVIALSKTLLVYEAYHDVVEKSKTNDYALQVLKSWAEAEWFLAKPKMPEQMTVSVFKVEGETNTDDLSPATAAWSRPDMPLHAKEMLKSRMEDIDEVVARLEAKGHPVAYVGDVVGTGSSRKSAMNSVMWFFGNDIPYVPNKRQGGIVLGGKIAPIFFNTAEDSGALPIECDVEQLNTGDVITIHPYDGKITNAAGETLSTFTLAPETLPDEVRAGGRVPLIIGRGLTDKARQALGLAPSEVFIRPTDKSQADHGYTLAQKMVGQACGIAGVRPGMYCEPRMTTVGSQDTTGAMTRDEMKELACLGFSADLVMQSFCHTAAYPKPVDIKLQHSLPDFMTQRGGVALRPGDGVIHSWLNRLLLPDTVGTGGDSHTRFPIGISFPAGSGLVAFAATLGVMPLNMPESVLVRFKGEMQPGITLRDLVNAIPYQAIQEGLLTVEKKGKKNIFSGRVLEIEGLEHLKAEQAFELSDASAERSANGCVVKLDKAPIIEYLQSNIALINWMVENGYESAKTLLRRRDEMQAWIDNPSLLAADADADYAAVIEIDLNTIKEPIVACPNDPDDVKLLSEVENTHIDEVFIGSCMTNIGHYRAAGKVLEQMGNVPTRLWIAPPTKMDEHQLIEEGYYSIFGKVGARTEMPGCSLCMGNQARVADGATVFSTSTRNFPNRLGNGANVYLGSAELAAVCSVLGRIPTLAEYLDAVNMLDTLSGEVYRYLQFDQLPDYQVESPKTLSEIGVAVA
ncbi:MAG: bifunctional aconitate hydratase 2/2-methylisocitrate dehydratase [Piscirickettsiaceae bacterium CG_4_9_14_3_um_filter_43_564]|nr:bifunctional aconitate hydratase 2/2-methylisocitrate dehydratase [Thiomicrospira sp.]OIP94555.1 MAG: bifunctional aconitate hydratase 2/2-methylisocitrate dehydratase [Thiomicrospira sp. CG2_30_44_34]PIQ02817.1 MAG: bifunctional aconitate hydratase 2/2-methylisocitrate dehydratase [Piscirickettsiaceae bacterium CG18_big_fil_WC_8_21_14_2_50_44_103]PIU37880.1 MAG: bifunctional aconitate hydratase 2/2-methylisocitrate dehydratase [Piscirickettsiaceae bacterium CG07_land_8_20_14_0_80_44_28]PIW5